MPYLCHVFKQIITLRRNDLFSIAIFLPKSKGDKCVIITKKWVEPVSLLCNDVIYL